MPAGRGMQDGLDVIDALAHHRSTARFISWKLAQRFVSDNPPQSLVDRMAETFLEKDGDLRVVLQTLFTSDEFFSDSAMQAKVKSPLEMTVSAARAVQAEVLDAGALAQTIAEMGQPLYNKVEPTGYANTAEPWLNTTGLLNRIKFASALASANVAGVNVNTSRFAGKNVGSIARELLGRDATAETLAAITEGVQGKQATPDLIVSLIIGSPEFQRK
jgi:uncharacterized protein (DUF1800 family)